MCITSRYTVVSNVLETSVQLIRYPNTEGRNIRITEMGGQHVEIQDAEGAKDRFSHHFPCLNTRGTSMAMANVSEETKSVGVIHVKVG